VYRKYASALNFFRAEHLTIFEQPPCFDFFNGQLWQKALRLIPFPQTKGALQLVLYFCKRVVEVSAD
jgi:hypothetical protein